MPMRPGRPSQTGNGRLNLARAIADTSSDSVKPDGAAPVGDGGPLVGPYVAAAVTAAKLGPATINAGAGFSYTITSQGNGNQGDIRIIDVVPAESNRRDADRRRKPR